MGSYNRVNSGDDLVRAKVMPKDSSTHLALIAYKRAEALRDTILAGVNDSMLGTWLPLVEQTYKDLGTEEVENPSWIQE